MESWSNFYVDDYLVTENDYVEHKVATAGDDKNVEEEDDYQQVMSIEDLLDLPNEEDQLMTMTSTDDDAVFHIPGNSPDSSATQPPHHHYSPTTFPLHHFSNSQLFLPCDDLADLEWVSNFVDESFSSDDTRNLHFIPNASCHHHNSPTDTCSSEETVTNKTNSPIFTADVAVPGKARSKRSRAAPCDWSSRILHLSPAAAAPPPPRKRESSVDALGRRCLHCASEKTPQWRTGPSGPKTLCNACGVRYKSGRLVPEYRPAASPTFVSAKHSNSHRKVVELRRQKELRMGQLGQSAIFGVSNADDAYLINPQSGRDFRNTNI